MDEKLILSVQDLAEKLNVSASTVRNWLKLKKIAPTVYIDNEPFFDQVSLKDIRKKLHSADNVALKKRRNKTLIKGNRLYSSYVTENCINLDTVKQIVEQIEIRHINLSDDLILALITDCAIKLILSKQKKLTKKDSIFKYAKGAYKKDRFMSLVDDLLLLNPFVLNCIDLYPFLFEYSYEYEQKEDILGLLQISLSSLGTRKANGVYYTPTRIVSLMCEKLFANYKDGQTIIDPCAGTGNFILQLDDSISYENVYGNEIDPLTAAIARINYALKYGISDREILKEHITNYDFLFEKTDKKFDYIISNPPWGYLFSENQKQKLKNVFLSAKTKNIESYDVFLEKAISSLKDDGALSFVLAEAILNVATHKAIRQIIIDSGSIDYLEYLANAFDNVQCPAVVMQIRKTNRKLDTSGMVVRLSQKEEPFVINTSRVVSSEFFSFNITDEEYELIKKLEKADNRYLKDNADFALGIVTGNNEKYISYYKFDDNEMVLRGSDIFKYSVAKTENYITFKPEQFQQVAKTEFYRAKEKLLYRFICSQLVFAYDNKQTLSLNSCNILIPKIPDLSIKYIMAILNSSIMQFYYQLKFNSVKVLRNHLEQLPIVYCDDKTQKTIEDLTDKIISSESNDEKQKTYEKINEIVASLYGLTDKEFELVKNKAISKVLF